ncbi:PEP-CTERM sorting domain-containing protein [Rubripirellula lacrimiformis]|uniref:PEP-CTERM sorting domain-containing protein n=1 Tax=Rubripirellula lacrimiformis TaxID=1930273 RepID=UPI001C54D63B|nr:PEP-CTERM sorting domain-containing protein [Rubripirellula lacrimiformis]
MSPTTSQSALIIDLDFSDFATAAPADGGTVLGGRTLADARAVVETAAAYWETAFANSSTSIGWSSNLGGTITQTISVGWGGLGGSTLATGGTGWFGSDGRWSSGSLTWDNDTSSSFFVDSTPTANEEWQQYSERDLTLGGVDVNVERVHYDAPAGLARSNSDMLSVAIHEVGHALGFLGTQFPAFADADLGSDNDIDVVGGVLDGAEIPFSGGHTSFAIESPSDEFPYDPGGGGFFPPFDYGPNALSPSIVTGTRKLLTEADIASVGAFLGFDQSTINFNPSVAAVPEPSTWACLLATGALVAVRRKRSRAAASA